MKHLVFRHIFLLACTLTILSSCNSLKSPELKSLEIVELSRSAGEGVLRVNLTYLNPNGKALTIKKVDVDGLINQKSIGKFSLSKRGRIERNSEETVELTFKFNPDNIYSGFLSKQFGAIGSKRVRVSLVGDAAFLKEDTELILPLDYSEIYKIPD